MDSRDRGRLAYEPPQLLRLTRPGDAAAAPCSVGSQPSCSFGSSDSGDCSTGKTPAVYCVVTGNSASPVCSGDGSGASVCSGAGSSG
jgi:hypothetical protein